MKIKILLICFFIMLFIILLSIFPKENCVIVDGFWDEQFLSDYSYNNETYCLNCLHYSFFVANKKFDYFASGEHILREDLKNGDKIKIKLCWSKEINGFLTEGIEKYDKS